MALEKFRQLLTEVQKGTIDLEEGLEQIEELLYKDLDFAKIDNLREERQGYAEVIYCENKTTEEIAQIAQYMHQQKNNVLATRANQEAFKAVQKLIPSAEYNEKGRIITIRNQETATSESYIAIVTAGTADSAVAEEAVATAEFFNNRVERIYDVGVAGIHRLFSKLELLQKAKVIIVIAGMEGALASVVGGLVKKPVIAVPTSVGYGANFNGLAPLLTMLNSCSSSVCVVNIDNGFGGAYVASLINQL